MGKVWEEEGGKGAGGRGGGGRSKWGAVDPTMAGELMVVGGDGGW
jgi:hypothetical protein